MRGEGTVLAEELCDLTSKLTRMGQASQQKQFAGDLDETARILSGHLLHAPVVAKPPCAAAKLPAVDSDEGSTIRPLRHETHVTPHNTDWQPPRKGECILSRS
jgi:hypothetical protein